MTARPGPDPPDPPPITWLYAPASRPDLVVKAVASRAHAVIVDLEDAVAPAAKAGARAELGRLFAEPAGKPVYVRVNPLSSPFGRADLEAVAALGGITGVHLPKVGSPGDVHRVLAVLAGAGASAERPLPLHCLVETAAGLEQAHAIATASAAVHGLSLGEADLSSDLGATGQGLDWARSRVIVAARAAGLPRPPQSVHPDVRDTEGLARSCRHGRALGHLGRAAIHPAQLAVIEAAYLPGPAEVAAASAALEGYRAALDAGQGAAALADGRFVDEAVVGAARFAVRLAEAYGTGADDP